MSNHEPDPSAGYEQSDALLRPVLIFTVALAVLIVVVVFAMRVVYDGFDDRAGRLDNEPHPMSIASEPPAPRLQTSTSADLAAHRERERALTGEYAWVDPTSKTVRIPIDRAIDLVLERGLPTRK